jgi:hypothetical protein
MNWGTKIIVVLSVFIIGIGSMVFICMKQKDMQLVTKDYYEQEIVYQNVIDKENNYRALLKKPVLQDKSENMIVLDFSQMENYQKISGVIYFFRPSQSNLDFRTMVEPDKDGIQYIDKTKISKGKWLVKLDWSDGIKEYYNEQTLYLQ